MSSGHQPGLITQLLDKIQEVEEGGSEDSPAASVAAPPDLMAPGLMTCVLDGLPVDLASASQGCASYRGQESGQELEVGVLTDQLAGIGLNERKEVDACVGLIYDPIMELHVGPEGHFECPERVSSLMAKLDSDGLSRRCRRLTGRQATDTELLRAHPAEHIKQVDNVYLDRMEATGDSTGGDMFASPETPAAVRTAAGCVTEGTAPNSLDAFTGGTAGLLGITQCATGQWGFCYFNNCAVAGLAALQEPGVDKVLILDWDVHHGNGIQDILDENPHIMYISIHRGNGFYPGTGETCEVGKGSGAGFTVNVPWPKIGFGDLDYMAAFDLVIEPVVSSFRPDLVIIAAGYDAVEGDPLGRMKLTAEGYGHMTKRIMCLCKSRVVVALEGGYNLRLTAECAAETVRVLLEGTTRDMPAAGPRNRLKHETKDVLEDVAKHLGKHWSCFSGRSFQSKHQAYFKSINRKQGPTSAKKSNWDVEIFV